QNKVKSVTIEDESLSPVNSDVESIIKNNQSSFDTNFGLSEAKKRNRLSVLEYSGKGKAVESDSDPKRSFDNRCKANIDVSQAFANVFGTPSSDNGSSFSKMGSDFSPRMPFTGEAPIYWNFQENVWKKRDLTKARNQWEYNEWCKAGLLLDKALFTGETKIGWEVAEKLALEDSMDPMSELFDGKSERARMAAQLFPKSKQPKIASSMFTRYIWAVWLDPGSSEFSPQNSWANMQSHQQTFSPSSSFNYMRTSNRFGTLKEVVCFLCEGKGHYVNEYGSRKHVDVPFHGDSARPKHTLGEGTQLISVVVSKAKKKNMLCELEYSKKRKAVESDSDPNTPSSDNRSLFFKMGSNFSSQMPSTSKAPTFKRMYRKSRILQKRETNGSIMNGIKQAICWIIGTFKRMYGKSRILQKHVALKRAYVVRVADEDGWEVAEKLALENFINPMSEQFDGKHERARMATQLSPKSKQSKIALSNAFSKHII
ncbi:3177_t:CDS:2, partial [Gigaspora rosea]